MIRREQQKTGKPPAVLGGLSGRISAAPGILAGEKPHGWREHRSGIVRDRPFRTAQHGQRTLQGQEPQERRSSGLARTIESGDGLSRRRRRCSRDAFPANTNAEAHAKPQWIAVAGRIDSHPHRSP